MKLSTERTCAICDSPISDYNPDGIGSSCRKVWTRATKSTYFHFHGLSHWKKKVDFFLTRFIEEFKDTKFRSEFRKSFYNSVKKQYETSGRISKKQLQIISDSFLAGTQHGKDVERFEEKERYLLSNLLFDYQPTNEEREYCVSLTKKYWAELKAEGSAS